MYSESNLQLFVFPFSPLPQQREKQLKLREEKKNHSFPGEARTQLKPSCKRFVSNFFFPPPIFPFHFWLSFVVYLCTVKFFRCPKFSHHLIWILMNGLLIGVIMTNITRILSLIFQLFLLISMIFEEKGQDPTSYFKITRNLTSIYRYFLNYGMDL